MTPTHTGWLIFAAAVAMMLTLLAPEISALQSWEAVFTPIFIGKLVAHLGAVITAFVGGRLMPTEGT